MPELNTSDVLKGILENTKPQLYGSLDPETGGYMAVPNGMKIQSIKQFLDEYRVVPERRVETVTVDRVDSFIALVTRFKSGQSVIFAKGEVGMNAIRANMTAILDYHPASGDVFQASNKGHRVKYDFPISKEFKFWIEHNAKSMEQGEFASLLEERIIEMVTAGEVDKLAVSNLSPRFAVPLEVLELARNLKIYSTENVQQAIKLSSGEKAIKFSAVHNGADGKPISIPDFFVINIPIFAGERTGTRILVRLRYRKQGEKILWSYDLYRVDNVFEQAFNDAIEFAQKATELPLYLGAAP